MSTPTLLTTLLVGSGLYPAGFAAGWGSLSTGSWPVLVLTLPAALAILVTAVLVTVKARQSAAGCQQDYEKLADQLERQSGRFKDNLDSLKSFTGPFLKPALTDLLADSESLFKGEWLAEPEAYLLSPSAFTQADTHWLSVNLAFRPGLLGLVSSILAFFFALATGSLNLLYGYVLLPLGLGLIATALLYGFYCSRRDRLARSAAACCRLIRLRLPVYDSRYGLSLLVDDFHEYDRQMASRIQDLDKTISGLAEAQFVAAMQTALTATLEKDINPVLTQAEETMKNLATSVQQEQSQGMKQLAESFAEKLKIVLETNWTPLFQQSGDLITGLTAASDRLAELTSAQADHLQEQKDLSDRLAEQIEAFNRQHRVLVADLADLNTTVRSLADRLQLEDDLQKEQTAGIRQGLARFTEDLNHFAESFSRAGENLSAERAAFSSLVEQTAATEARAVADYRLLSTQITAAAMDMQDSNKKMADLFQKTDINLENNVQAFSEGMEETVKACLSELEDTLGKISLHLATGTAAVESSVRDLERAVHLLEKK